MPIADEEEMEKLNDWLPPAVIVNGPEGCVVDPTGNPERVTVTEPVNPFTAATATDRLVSGKTVDGSPLTSGICVKFIATGPSARYTASIPSRVGWPGDGGLPLGRPGPRQPPIPRQQPQRALCQGGVVQRP